MSNTDDQMVQSPPVEEQEAATPEQTDEQIWNSFQQGDGPDGNEEPDTVQGEPEAADDFSDDGKAPGIEDGKDPSPDGETSEANDGQPEGSDPEDLQEQLKRLQHELDTAKGRSAAKGREIKRLKADIASARRPQRTEEDDKRQKESKEKLAAAKEEYGDVIGPLADTVAELETRIETLNAREQQDLEIKQAQLNELQSEEQSAFLAEHPDGFDLVNKEKDRFAAWVDDQSARMRSIFAQNKTEIVNGTEAAFLLTKFKQHLTGSDDAPAHNSENERLQARRESQKAGSQSTRSKSARTRSSAVPPKDSGDANAHWDYFDRMDKHKG